MQAMEVIAELMAKLPEVEIDRFTYDYDTALYHDNSQSMTENVSELAEALQQRDTHDIAMWLADVVTEGAEPEGTKRAMELLKKLTDYKPLAKIAATVSLKARLAEKKEHIPIPPPAS